MWSNHKAKAWKVVDFVGPLSCFDQNINAMGNDVGRNQPGIDS